jgi:aerobic-type carbon monoxide dehydrogenase small subunit (CoxS/CutS family)
MTMSDFQAFYAAAKAFRQSAEPLDHQTADACLDVIVALSGVDIQTIEGRTGEEGE